LAEKAPDDAYLKQAHPVPSAVIRFFGGEFRDAADAHGAVDEAVFLESDANSTRARWIMQGLRLFHLLALRHVGDMRELHRLATEYIRDARQRGDRYTETT